MSQDLNREMAGETTAGTWYVDAESQSQGTGCLWGCLITTAVLLSLAATGSWFVAQNWRGWAGTVVRGVLEQTLDDTTLPEEEKIQIQEQVDRVVIAFEEGRLTEAQVERMMIDLAESPLAGTVIAFSIERKYFDVSGLSEEEKQEGRTTLQRCVRGWMDGLLTEEDVEAVLSHIGTKDAEGNWDLHDEVSDEDLRAFLADAKERADTAGVAETVEEVDPSEEIKRIVDAALNPEAADMNMDTEAEMESAPADDAAAPTAGLPAEQPEPAPESDSPAE